MPTRPLPETELANERPVKRRRVEVPCPDGFLSDSRLQKLTVPKFSSAFDEDRSKGKIADFQTASKHSEAHTPVKVKSVTEGTSRRPPSSSWNPHKFILLETPLQKKNVAQLRPAPPPPQMTSVPLKQVSLPAFAVQSGPKVPLKAHNPLPPPAPVLPTPRKMADAKDLRTISTTAIGRLTALSSENGGEDLAAILLRDQHLDIPAVENRHADDASRGLQMSPEKKGKKNTPKYIRGGLAARASTFFDRSKTSLLLWKKDIEHRSKVLPDLSATIIKVLHEPIPPSRRSTSKTLPLSPGIALCRIRQQKAHKTYPLDQLYRIVFSFSNSPFPERFREGQSVRIYWPWQEVSFTRADPQIPPDESHPRLPASLPLPLSLPSTPDLSINDTTLLCSRFLIS